MSIPKAAPNEVFAYYFQSMILAEENENFHIFLDRYCYEPVKPVLIQENKIWMATEDLRRIFAPYLKIAYEGKNKILEYCEPGFAERKVDLTETAVCTHEGWDYLDLRLTMDALEKKSVSDDDFTVFLLREEDTATGNKGISRIFYQNFIHGKICGMQYFTIWDENSDRLIPYRMYIPCSYELKKPMKAVVCFHVGDANSDYMFRLTDNEICRYAEQGGYILLALTSYRKFTFFGASRIPTGTDIFDPEAENPLGLTVEEWEYSLQADASVMLQIEDAQKRYRLDEGQMYALGNSGGSLGIFHQVQVIGRPYFRAVCCAGGIQSPSTIDYDRIAETGTEFLIVYGSEDAFDGQRIIRENMPLLVKNGMKARLLIVGGGEHLTAWTKALKEIFDFFEEFEEHA